MAFGVAVLGTGRIGGRYIDVVKQTDGAELKVVAEPREEQVVDLKVEYTDVDFVADYHETLERDDVGVVIGTLPHWLHHQAAIDAVNSGKHVFLEKPMALTVAQCDEMLAAARANGKMIMTAHTQRYYPYNRKIKEIIDSKELGEFVMGRAFWHKPLNPELRPEWMLHQDRGGGMGYMDCTHLIDRLIWHLGPDIYSVNGITGNYCFPEIDADDTGMHFLRWESGRVATISRMAFRTGATDSGGDYYFTDGQVRVRQGLENGLWIARGNELEEIPIDSKEDSLHHEFTDFIQALDRGDSDTPIPMEHGRHVLQVLEATEESNRTGREVILN